MKHTILYFNAFLLAIFLLPYNLIAQPKPVHALALSAKEKVEVNMDSVAWKDYPSFMQTVSATKGIVLENNGVLGVYDLTTGKCTRKYDLTNYNYKPVYRELVTLNNKPHYWSYDSLIKTSNGKPFLKIENFTIQDAQVIVPVYLLNRSFGPIPGQPHLRGFNYSQFVAIVFLDTNLDLQGIKTIKLPYPSSGNVIGFNKGFVREEEHGFFILRNYIADVPQAILKEYSPFMGFTEDEGHYIEMGVFGSPLQPIEWQNKNLFKNSYYHFYADSIDTLMTNGYAISGYNYRDTALYFKKLYRPDSAIIGKFTISRNRKWLYYIINDWNIKQKIFTPYLVKYDIAKQKMNSYYTLPTENAFGNPDFVGGQLILTSKEDEKYYFLRLNLP